MSKLREMSGWRMLARRMMQLCRLTFIQEEFRAA